MFSQDTLISHFGDIPWTPQSLDLSATDFFLWGHLKNKSISNKAAIQSATKNTISQGIEEINRNREILQCVMNNFHQRLKQILRCH
jgi:hypothetical protein